MKSTGKIGFKNVFAREIPKEIIIENNRKYFKYI
jgi:hypothetical protein